MIDSAASAIVSAALNQFYTRRPALKEAHGAHGIAKCREDCFHHLEVLTTALRTGVDHVFVEYILWVRNILRERHISPDGLDAMLELLSQEIRFQTGPKTWEFAKPLIHAAIEALNNPKITHHAYIMPPQTELMQTYLQALLAGDQNAAQQIALDAFQNGMPIHEIYLTIFQSALYEIGRLWETGQISVAQEHLATAITQTAIAVLYAQTPPTKSRGESAIVACLEDNHHQVGPRMLADLLQFVGYDARFLGANTPQQDLLHMIQAVQPAVVGLPATLPGQVETVRKAIEAIRATFPSNRPVIMVGGIAFNQNPELWRVVGADLWGMDAHEAIGKLRDYKPPPPGSFSES